jgi:hypothetical protein
MTPKEGLSSLYWSIAVLLEPAAKASECFVCAVQKRDFDRHLFWFLEENYNSGPTINNLLASQGLCVHHMQVLRERRVQWQISFFGELLMDHNRRLADKALKKARSAQNAGLTGILRPAPRLGGVFAPKSECPFCALIRESEGFVLTALAGSAADAELETVWRDVCLPHGLMLAPLLPAEAASSVADSLRSRLDAPSTDAAAFFLGAFPRATRAEFSPSIEAELLAGQRVPFNPALLADEALSSVSGKIEWTGCPLCATLRTERGFALEAEVQEYCRPDIAAMLGASAGAVVPQLGRWARQAIEQRVAHPSHRKRAKTVTTTTCPACRRRSERMVFVLSALEKAPAKRFQRVRFCIPHFPLVLERVSPEVATTILESQRSVFQHLNAELAEFFRKADYRFHDEPRGSEQTAWMRAADILAGCWLPQTSEFGEPAARIRKEET